MDNFTDHMAKTGFIQVRMELDVFKLLLLGMLIQRRIASFWQ